MAKVYGVLGMPAGDLSAKQAIKAAGCTHTVIVAKWGSLQPNGPGTALDTTQLTLLMSDFSQARQVGLKVFFEFAIHYPPAWVLAGGNAVEQFVDQNSATYNASGADSGKQVTNWMWTALGRQYVQDFISRVAAGIGPANVSAVDDIKTGGGWYGELHYPPAAGSGSSFYGYSNAMQTGTGLAVDQITCPLPGYNLFSGTDAQDSQWLNWYLNGITTWLQAFIIMQRAAGFNGDYHVCLPGYGVRSNQPHSNTGYRQAAALGEDPVRVIAATAADSRIWPYSTWMNTADGFAGGTADSDKSAWKKHYEEAFKRNKHFKLWGENTGNEDTAGLNAIFSGAANGSAMSSEAYPGSPGTVTGYNGIFWLQYSTLTAGGNSASMSDFAAKIAANP